MKRWLLSVLAVISLILCLTTLAFWAAKAELEVVRTRDDASAKMVYIHSFTFGDRFVWTRQPMVNPWLTTSETFSHCRTRRKPDGTRPLWMFDQGHAIVCGFEVVVEPKQSRPFQYYAIPAWFLGLVFAVFPALWARTWLIARRREKKKLCVNCGYDLRATPDRCPECGATVLTSPSRPLPPRSHSPASHDCLAR